MNIKYTDKRKETIAYQVIGDVIYANYGDKVYKADFTDFEDGVMVGEDIGFVSGIYKVDGVLNMTLARAVDTKGMEILQDDFGIEEYEEIQIEWKNQTIINDEELLESLFPTEDEIKNAELEIAMISLLQDLEVI